MFKPVCMLVLALVCSIGHADDEGKLMSDLETQTALAQKRLGLLQAQAAIVTFNGTGGQPLPQIVSLYSSNGLVRALVDMGASGIRDVGRGDALTETLAVSKIDANRGVEVRVVGAKASRATFFLVMKAATLPATPGAAPAGFAGGIVPAQSGGYPLVNSGVTVPPLRPMAAAR